MSRFEQRLRERMQNPEFAAGYREMDAELALLHAIDETRERLHVSKEELAARMGRQRAAVSRLLTDEDSNPTLSTLTDLFTALGVTADITLRRAEEGEAPIKVDSTVVG